MSISVHWKGFCVNDVDSKNGQVETEFKVCLILYHAVLDWFSFSFYLGPSRESDFYESDPETELMGELEHLNSAERNDVIFGPKAISVLSSDSPFFDAFWPVIFAAADSKTKNNLELTNTYFRGMAKLAKAHDLSRIIKTVYLEGIKSYRSQTLPPNPLRLDPHSDSPMWYSWGADKAGFKSPSIFEEFCRIGDVNPSEGVPWNRYSTPSYSFLSSTGDLNFVCHMDPRGQEYAYVHYFGCTGEREKALKLEAWFMKNCQWDEVCFGGRNFG